ncbi:hypothetical protein WMY93_034158 [Mugilogobius chulae]|uniref:Dihydrolipoamide acetyltransferase component of pyruvate dehydrogenase complex n=1 Tax=Mugilogobius chulae TaxID=88201 RepID=A0AAW0MIN8_9GOBI
MLSHSRCLTRNLGRSLSVIRQGNNVFSRQATAALSTSHGVIYNKSLKSQPRSSVFQIQYFRTSAAYRDEVVTVKTPAFAESVTEGDVRWEKAVGDSVTEDEVVCEIETDKTSVQVPSPAAGVIEELLVPDGGKVEGGTPLFKLRKGVSAIKATPAPAPAAPAASAEGVTKGARTESRVKMNRMRLRIAQRLKEAQNTCAMLTTFNEVDMRAIKTPFLKKHNIKLGFMSAFVKAAAYALSDQPAVNAVIDDTTKEIVYRDYVDISVAGNTKGGNPSHDVRALTYDHRLIDGREAVTFLRKIKSVVEDPRVLLLDM